VSINNTLLDFVGDEALDVVSLRMVSREVSKSYLSNFSLKRFSLWHFSDGVKFKDVFA